MWVSGQCHHYTLNSTCWYRGSILTISFPGELPRAHGGLHVSKNFTFAIKAMGVWVISPHSHPILLQPSVTVVLHVTCTCERFCLRNLFFKTQVTHLLLQLLLLYLGTRMRDPGSGTPRILPTFIFKCPVVTEADSQDGKAVQGETQVQ